MSKDPNKKKGKYTFGPVTDKDVVINIKTPMVKEPSEVMIFGEKEVIISLYKTGRVPDPRIALPLYQNMDIFDDDIFLCAFGKCGTHWVWEMCQMLIKGKAEFHSQAKESCMMEQHMPEDFKDLDRPRLFNTHSTPMWIPRKAIEKNCKFIILRRNPKDIVTSRYHHVMKTKELYTNVEKDTSWHSFLQCVFDNDRDVSSNWFFYNKKWAEFIESNGQLVLVLNYEDIKLNTFDCLSKIAEFIGFPRDASVLDEIIKKCSISNMREIEKERPSGSEITNSQPGLVSKLYRKGVVGDWKEHFTVAENEQFDAFLKKFMKDEDLNFKYEL